MILIQSMAIDLESIIILIDLLARIFSFLGFGLATYFYFIKRERATLFNPFLASAILFGFATFTLYIIDLITWIQWESDNIRRFLHGYAYGFLGLFLFSWYKHYEAIDGNSSSWQYNTVLIPVSSIWTIIGLFTMEKIFFPIFGLTLDFELISDEAFVTIISHPTWITGIIVYFIIFGITNKMVEFSGQESSKREHLVAKILILDFALLELGNFSLTFNLIEDNLGYLILVIGLILFEFGFLILVYNNIIYPSYQFYLPQAVEGIFIYNKSGLLLHSITFSSDTNMTEEKRHIMASLLSAISSLFKETLGYSVELNKINLEGFSVLFLSNEKYNITMVVISSYDNYFLQRGMIKFFENIPPKLEKEFHKIVFKMTPELRKITSELIMKTFPFLVYLPETEE